MKKVTMVLFLVCFLACSSVWALDGFSALKKNAESSDSAPAAEETAAMESQTVSSQPTSETKALKTSTALDAVSTTLSANSTLSRKQLTELSNQLAIVQSDIEALSADNKAKEKEILRLTGTRPYLMGGLTLGFEDKNPKMGVKVDGGIRCSGGLMVGANVSYGLITFKPGKADMTYNLDRWGFGVSAGYMW